MAFVDLCMLLVYTKIILLHDRITIRTRNRNGTGAVVRNGLILVQDLITTIIEYSH